MSANTKKTYEELETSEELKARGLQRIKRKFRPKKGEMTIRDCQVITEIRIDADLYNYLESKKTENSSVEKILNDILREKFEREENEKAAQIRQLRTELLNDSDFLNKLKEKLAA